MVHSNDQSYEQSTNPLPNGGEAEELIPNEARLQRLHQASARLAQTQGLAETRQAITDEIKLALGAHIVLLRFVVPGGLATEVVALDPDADVELIHSYNFVPTEAHSAPAKALRERQPVFLRNKGDFAQYPEYTEVLQRMNVQAGLYLPLVRQGAVIAVVSAAFRKPQAFDEAERTIALTLAERSAAALERAQLHEALRTSEQLFRTLADTIPQIVWITRPDGSGIDYLNAQWLNYTGLSYEESLRDPFQIIHPDDLAPVLTAWQQAWETGQQYQTETRLRGVDGTYRWFLSRSTSRNNDAGQLVGWFGTSTDIHERKQAEADAHMLSELGEQIRASDNADRLLASVVEQIGRHLDVRRCFFGEIDEPHDRWLVQHEYSASLPSLTGDYRISTYSPAVVQALRSGQVLIADDMSISSYWAESYAERYAPISIRATIIVPFLRDGQWVLSLTITTDTPRQWQPHEVRLLETIAERIWLAVEKLRAIEALRASETRLQALYVREQAARAQAEEASRLKDEFLTTVSHELRTPLTAFLGYARLLQSRPRDEAFTARTLDTMVRTAETQAQLIEDLLDVSRIVSGKLRIELQPVSLISVIRAALDTVNPTIEAKGLHLQTDLNPAASTIIGDANRLQQIVWNLLANAAKFTPPGGTVQVRLEPRGHMALFTVSDTGQGISAAFLPYVFDRFRQAESTSTRAYGGLGLGLSIVRHLVELHGGSVQATSAGAGHGASFSAQLPLASPLAASALAHAATRPPTAKAAYPPKLRGLRVLIVDDQQDILELLYDACTPCGIETRISTTARHAFDMFQAWRPDVLISDIAMPLEDGYWLIRMVRALPPERGGQTPAIALTAYGRAEQRARALEAGFQHYLPKPVEASELLAVVASLAPSTPSI
ncbi:MAG: GAF domain-containing protein [Roseiflexaceae bacterium]|nr:GAF domain-containing protein [Roseiflexaceae bacterium]